MILPFRASAILPMLNEVCGNAHSTYHSSTAYHTSALSQVHLQPDGPRDEQQCQWVKTPGSPALEDWRLAPCCWRPQLAVSSLLATLGLAFQSSARPLRKLEGNKTSHPSPLFLSHLQLSENRPTWPPNHYRDSATKHNTHTRTQKTQTKGNLFLPLKTSAMV